MEKKKMKPPLKLYVHSMPTQATIYTTHAHHTTDIMQIICDDADMQEGEQVKLLCLCLLPLCPFHKRS